MSWSEACDFFNCWTNNFRFIFSFVLWHPHFLHSQCPLVLHLNETFKVCNVDISSEFLEEWPNTCWLLSIYVLSHALLKLCGQHLENQIQYQQTLCNFEKLVESWSTWSLVATGPTFECVYLFFTKFEMAENPSCCRLSKRLFCRVYWIVSVSKILRK